MPFQHMPAPMRNALLNDYQFTTNWIQARGLLRTKVPDPEWIYDPIMDDESGVPEDDDII
jgi:hypothetical protein